MHYRAYFGKCNRFNAFFELTRLKFSLINIFNAFLRVSEKIKIFGIGVPSYINFKIFLIEMDFQCHYGLPLEILSANVYPSLICFGANPVDLYKVPK